MPDVPSLQDYVTLPQEFFLNLDFENKVLVERVTFDPAQLLSGGPQQVAIKKLTEVSQQGVDPHAH